MAQAKTAVHESAESVDDNFRIRVTKLASGRTPTIVTRYTASSGGCRDLRPRNVASGKDADLRSRTHVLNRQVYA